MQFHNRPSSGDLLPLRHTSIPRSQPSVVLPRDPMSSSVQAPVSSERLVKRANVDSGVKALPKKSPGLSVRVMDGVATLSLMALFFGLPIFFTGITLQGVAFDKQLYFYFWLLVGVVCWAVKGVLLNEMHIRRTPLDAPLFFLLGVYLVSTLLSIDRWHSSWGGFGDPSRGLLSVFSLAVAYYFLFSHLNARRLRWMIWSVALSGVILAAWSVVTLMGVSVLPDQWRFFVPLSLTGTLGTLTLTLGALLPLWIVLIVQMRSKNSSYQAGAHVLQTFFFIGITLTLFVLFALYDYTAWWAILIGIAFFLMYILARIIRFSEKWKWLPMIVMVVLLATFMVGNTGVARVKLPVEVSPNTQLSWEVATRALKDRWLFGSGPSTYGYAFSQYRPQEYNLQPLYTMRFSQGSGVLFETLSTMGIAGVFALVLFGLSFLSVGLYLLSQTKESEKMYSLGLWSSSIVIIAGAVLTPVNGTVILLGSLMATLALAMLMQESYSEERFWYLSLQSSPKFALVFAFIFIVVSAGVAFLFVFMGKIALADALAGKAMRQVNASNMTNAAETLTQSIRYVPQEGRYSSVLGQIYMALIQERASTEEGKQDIETLKRYLTAASSAVAFGRDAAPFDVSAYEAVAQNYENMAVLIGSSRAVSDNLQKTYEKASELEPNNPIFYVKRGQLKQAQAADIKDAAKLEVLDEARVFYEKAVEKKPDLADGYVGLAQVQAETGDKDVSIQTLRDGMGKAPNSLLMKYALGRALSSRGHEDDLKEAVALLSEVVAVDTKNVNVYLELALANEKRYRDKEALQAYQKILSILSEDQSEMGKKVKERVNVMIDTVRNGNSNVVNAGEEAISESSGSGQTLPSASAPPIAIPPEMTPGL